MHPEAKVPPRGERDDGVLQKELVGKVYMLGVPIIPASDQRGVLWVLEEEGISWDGTYTGASGLSLHSFGE